MAQSIQDLDANFKEKELVGGFAYRPLYSIPGVVVEGLYPGTFCRINPDILPSIPNGGVQELAWHTAGGTVRFRVPGGKFAIRGEMRSPWDMSHMPRSGSSGVDVYTGTGRDRFFVAGFRQEEAGKTNMQGEVTLPEGYDEVLIHLPLYNGLTSLELGFPPDVEPLSPTPYRYEKPVLFYGSSITQGGCASRPGNAYTAMAARMLDCSHYNMGFSGSALGEQIMAEYIANIPMSVFVYDYDHNAPDPEHLQKTHLPFLRTILEKQPELPVILISRPLPPKAALLIESDAKRREAIARTYLWLQEQGHHVEFIDGQTLFTGPLSGDCTVDGCHPNDLGFFRMASLVAPAIQRALDFIQK